MDRYVVNHLPRICGVVLALAGLSALLGFHESDPTLFNLHYPAHGVANPMGYAGALVGGTLLDLFGGGTLILPPLILLWFMAARDRPNFTHYALNALVLLAAISIMAALWGAGPGLGLGSPGIIGLSGRRWIMDTSGPWLAQVLLVLVLGYALRRLIYLQLFRRAFNDGRIFAAFGLARAGTLAARAARAVRRISATANGRARAVSAAAQTMLATGLRRSRYHVRGAASRMTRGIFQPTYKVRRSSRDRWQPSGHSTPPVQPVNHAEVDEFDAWFEAVPETAPYQDSSSTREAHESGATGAAAGNTAPVKENRGSEEWRERFDRYTQNLDLDWDRRGDGLVDFDEDDTVTG